MRYGGPAAVSGLVIVAALWASILVPPALGQIQMPDPREMSGLPLPSGDLPDGVISVRVIRGQLSNNIVDHPVELHEGDTVRVERTDENGRAQFTGIPSGATVRAVATVAGETLESRSFGVPATGGIRLMLVATATEEGGAVGAASGVGGTSAPRIEEVTLGGDSRMFIELDEDALQVYYLLDVMNPRAVPVMPPSTLVLDMPTGAQGTTLLEDSSPQANVNGTRVTVPGPFPPGATPVHVAYVVPHGSAEVTLTQRFPVPLEQVAVIVQRVDEMQVESAQLANRREVTSDGRTFIVGGGPRLASGDALTLVLTGLPHHSRTGRYVALVLALMIVAAGVWGAGATGEGSLEVRRQRLVTRRDTLLADLVKIEERLRAEGANRPKDVGRKRELTAELARIYGELDRELGEAPRGVASARSPTGSGPTAVGAGLHTAAGQPASDA